MGAAEDRAHALPFLGALADGTDTHSEEASPSPRGAVVLSAGVLCPGGHPTLVGPLPRVHDRNLEPFAHLAGILGYASDNTGPAQVSFGAVRIPRSHDVPHRGAAVSVRWKCARPLHALQYKKLYCG